MPVALQFNKPSDATRRGVCAGNQSTIRLLSVANRRSDHSLEFPTAVRVLVESGNLQKFRELSLSTTTTKL